MDRQGLSKQTLDLILRPSANAKHIVGLVKEVGRITGSSSLTKPSFPSRSLFPFQSKGKSQALASPTGVTRNI